MLLNIIMLAVLYFFCDSEAYIDILRWGGYFMLSLLGISLLFVRTSGKRYATRLYVVFLKI